MANSLSEGFIRQTYTGTDAPHHAIFPVAFDGTPVPGVAPMLTQKGGTPIGFVSGYTEWIDFYRGFFNASTQFGLAEVYAVDPDTEERTFLFGIDVGEVGTNAAGRIPLAMTTMTFKTIAGGVLRVVFMENVFLVNNKFYPPYTAATPEKAISDYVVSDDSILIGRDNAYAFAPISLTAKTSDALRAQAGI